MGPKVKKFEETFVSSFGWTDGVMNNSGSSANLLAVAALANPATEDGLQARRRGDRAGALLVDDRVADHPVRPRPGDRRHRSGDLQHRSQRDREGDRAEDARRHDRAGLRQSLRHGCDRRHLQAPQPDPDRGLLRGARRLLRRQGGRQVRPRRHLQLLLLAPHDDARGRHHRHRRFRAGRADAHPARPWLGARGEGSRPLAEAVSRHRPALPVRECRLQPAADGVVGRDGPGAAAEAREVRRHAPREFGLVPPRARPVRRLLRLPGGDARRAAARGSASRSA